jgi:hypothetical protein
MNNQLPTIIKCRINNTVVEICHGPIPDICRELWFGQLVEPKLPDRKVTDKEFEKWLDNYRTE